MVVNYHPLWLIEEGVKIVNAPTIPVVRPGLLSTKWNG